MLEDGKPVQLTAGQEVTITTDYAKPGNSGLIAMSYPKLAHDVKPGSTILCADGSIVLEVVSTNPGAGTVQARCKNTAMLGERKNVNLPGVVVDLPTLTEKDVDDLLNWGVPNEIDLIAASFVRKGADLDHIREVLGEKGRYINIISKVENQEGIQNFDEILDKTDAVMVARGDLGMEIPTEKIFLAQKMMIQKCNFAGMRMRALCALRFAFWGGGCVGCVREGLLFCARRPSAARCFACTRLCYRQPRQQPYFKQPQNQTTSKQQPQKQKKQASPSSPPRRCSSR
jgi:pyruvate kinase